MKSTQSKIRTLTGAALLSALIIVLQIVSNFIPPVGGVTITLSLVPIVIGAAMFGPLTGAFLGFVLGGIVFISGLLGWDGGFVLLLLKINPYVGVFICFFKTIAAGFVSGLLHKILVNKNKTLSVFASSMVCPIVNTGLFVLAMTAFYSSVFSQGASDNGTSVLVYLILVVAGVNFIVEFLINTILSPAILRIIDIVKKNK